MEAGSVAAINPKAPVRIWLATPLLLSICEELCCCMLSPYEIRLVTSSNLYLCVTSELPGEDGNPFIPVLVPFLGKVSIKSVMRFFCCCSGVLHRRHRITRFTGCFITADNISLHYLLYSSPLSMKESKSPYLLLLGI